MKRHRHHPGLLPFVLAIGGLSATACDGDDEAPGDDTAADVATGAASADDDGTMESRCAMETRADDFAVGLAKDGAAVRVEISSATPASPIRDDNAWTLMVTDLAGAPLEGMVVDASPWMPDHGHGTPVEEVVLDQGGGLYQVDPLNLFMAGYWEVTFEITDAEGNPDEVMFGVCVE
jgi:hypothetical protein